MRILFDDVSFSFEMLLAIYSGRILILDFRFDFPDYRDDIVREIINSDYRMLPKKGYFFTRFTKDIDS